MRSLVLRNALLGAITLCGVGLLAAAPAQALTFNLTSDHCTGGCGTAPFGTVTLTQAGANVEVDVVLTAGYSFVKSGSADFQNFKFNGVDVALTDIVVDPHTPALVRAEAPTPGGFKGDGTGEFTFGINCPSCANGGAGKFTAPIGFTVLNATIADLTAPNNLGNIFVADVLAPNGNTGPVDVSAVPGPVVGAGLPGLVLACGGLLALARRRRRPLA